MIRRKLLYRPLLIILGCYLLVCQLSCNQKQTTLFTSLSPAETGVKFSNRIFESDSVNILENEYVYNGGGVGIGDFNNDQLPDLYFTGNMTSNRLYLNKGQMRFEDITSRSKVEGQNKWCSGVAVVDINSDGLDDIYVCATFSKDSISRKNLLYVNQGNDKDGIPQFRELADQYGIADYSHSTNAAFFDYDRDGDLDLYVLANEIDAGRFPNKYHHKITDGSAPGTDRLYENSWSDSLKHPVFKDVSRKAGILLEGFGLGLHISDINRDGWPDIYVTNDYISDDLLYINNRNGTFTNRAKDYLKHTSFSAMGNDIADINNDGLQDIIAVDMLPADNYRKKMMLNPNNYSSYLNTEEYKYGYQYVRNTLQLNMGNIPSAENPHPIFSDIAWYSSVAATDWSWTPMVVDFDNDGFRDIIITNGFPKDVTDHDFISYRQNTKNYAPKNLLLGEIPSVKLKNVAFRNNGNLSFSDVSDNWGIDEPSFSNGAAYADLDLDGDLDYVVNNINDSAFVCKNNSFELNKPNSNYLRVELEDTSSNTVLGSMITISYSAQQKNQIAEYTPYRGYLSTVEKIVHFGLGKDSVVDEIVVKWPDGSRQVLHSVKANQRIVIEKNPVLSVNMDTLQVLESMFKEMGISGIKDFLHKERDYIDFNVQKLLPHKFSQYGPALAVGDINKDGLEDLVVGGSYGYSASIFYQNVDGSFRSDLLDPGASMESKQCDDAGLLLFDADNDDDLDLYISSGGFESKMGSSNYRDRFYVNDGKGHFKIDSTAIPSLFDSKSCVKAADFDRDGDLDLFVGARVRPGRYPMSVSSLLLRNVSTNSKPQFEEVTAQLAPSLVNLGLACDMLWTDYDNDGWIDMVLTGEWMPICFLKNRKGSFTNETSKSGIDQNLGWWNSLVGGDFDNDGDIDYVAGNVGLNSFFKASTEHPVKLYAADYNNDGSFDAIPSVFLPAIDGSPKEFPAFGRDDMIKQMIGFKARFTNYASFAQATIDKMLSKSEIDSSLRLQANYLASAFIRNEGNGSFSVRALPQLAQLSAVNAMVARDINADGNLDLILTGNDYGIEISTGRYDAMNGLVLTGDGKGNFTPMNYSNAGFFVPGDGKALVELINRKNQLVLIASQNASELKTFGMRSKAVTVVSLLNGEEWVEYKFKNGASRKSEIYWGHSFYSQSGHHLYIDSTIESLTIVGSKSGKRIIKF